MKKSYLVAVFALAAICRFALYYAMSSTDPSLFLDYDSYGYLRIAHNLLNYNFFSQGDINYLYSYIPDSQRTPFYPYFLKLILQVGLDYPEAITFQLLLGSVTAVLVSVFIYKLSKNNLIALIAGLIVAIDISSIHMANRIMTETWFTFVFVLFLFSFLAFVKNKHYLNLILSGLLLGILLLIRPVATYLPFVFVIYFLFLSIDLKKKVTYGLLLVTIPFLVASPWYYRNYKTFGVPFLSIIKEINLIYCTTRAIRMRSENLSYNEFKAIYDKKLLDDYDERGKDHIKAFLEFAPTETYKYIKKEPLLFVRNTVEAFVLNLLMPDNIDGLIYNTTNPKWQSLPQQQYSLGLFTLAKAAVIKASNFLLLAFTWICTLLTFNIWWKNKKIPPIYLVLVLIWLYFNILSAPSGMVLRFRIPLWPVWLGFCVPGMLLLIEKMKTSRISLLRKLGNS